MNITDLIVELLQQGRQVELAGIGTFGSEMQPPHHDQATATYYPASRTLTFSTATSGDESIVETLAERECVGVNVARQMWKNYMDALTDKLQRTGSHTFGELGTLSRGADGYSFAVTPGLVLNTGDEQPLEGVRTYDHTDNDDPFAQFEDNSAELKAQQEAAARAEQERLEAERRAEQERLEAERRAEQERLEAERRAEQERQEAERRAEQERLEAERRAEQERQEAEAKAASEREAEEERQAVAAAAALAALNTNTATANAETIATTKPAKEKKAKKAKPAKEKKAKKAKKAKKEDNGKKRRFPWWILFLLLLLLLLGGAAYYYFKVYRPSQPTAEYIPSSRPTDVELVTDLTYNTDMLTYGPRDIDHHSDRVCRYMTDYIYSYLAYRHYTSAMAPMMERVHQYATQRLGELMADRFAVQRLYPFNDYIYSHNEPYLHQKFAAAQRVKVQGELLDMNTLDGMLDQLVNELGLEPDAAAAAQPTPAVAQRPQPAATRQQPTEEAPVRVSMEEQSRQGFDIIAGFYLDRATAARLTARLHELGSDAYIIEKNNMYYVSMGSAKSRTAAEALFKHIKAWYDGDIAIKQW